MTHDPFVSCQGCPKHVLGCRPTCEGWAFREEKQRAEYALREIQQSAVPDHAGYKKILRDRQRHNQMKGR